MSGETSQVTLHCNPDFNRFNLDGQTVLSKGTVVDRIKGKTHTHEQTVTVNGESYNVTFEAHFYGDDKTLVITGPKQALEVFFIRSPVKAAYMQENVGAGATDSVAYALDINAYNSCTRKDRPSQALLTWLRPRLEDDYLFQYRDPHTGQFVNSLAASTPDSQKPMHYNPLVLMTQEKRLDEECTSLTPDELRLLVKQNVTQQDIKKKEKQLKKLLEKQSPEGFKPENFPDIFNYRTKKKDSDQVLELTRGDEADSPWVELEKDPKRLFEMYQETARFLLKGLQLAVAIEFIKIHNAEASSKGLPTIQFKDATHVVGNPYQFGSAATSAFGATPPLKLQSNTISDGFVFSKTSPAVHRKERKRKLDQEIEAKAAAAKAKNDKAKAEKTEMIQDLTKPGKQITKSQDDSQLPSSSALPPKPERPLHSPATANAMKPNAKPPQYANEDDAKKAFERCGGSNRKRRASVSDMY